MLTPTIQNMKVHLPPGEGTQIEVLKQQLFQHVSSFTGDNEKPNVVPDVLDCVLASLLIHLEDLIKQERATRNSPISHYIYQVCLALQASNDKLGSSLTLECCVEWGAVLRRSWQTRNHLQVGKVSTEWQVVLEVTATQLLGVVSGL